MSIILSYLAAGGTGETVIAEYPDSSRQQIAACLDYARDLAEFEVSASCPSDGPVVHRAFP